MSQSLLIAQPLGHVIDELVGADTIAGNEDDDVIIGGAAGDKITGDAGNDIIFGDNARATLAAGVVQTIATTANDTGGADTIRGSITSSAKTV